MPATHHTPRMILEIIQAFVFATIPVAAFTWLLTLWALRSGHLTPYGSRKEFGASVEAMTKARKDKLKAEKARRKLARKSQKEAEETAGGDEEAATAVDIEDSPKSRAARAQGLLQEKWMRFGGNFYGTMIFITWLHIELIEVFDFITTMTWPDSLGIGEVLGFIISVIIATIVNFIRAVIWFTYWPDVIEGVGAWLLLVGAYLGYQIGAKYGSQRFQRERGRDGIDPASEAVDEQ